MQLNSYSREVSFNNETVVLIASKSSSFFKRRKKKQKSRRDTIDCVPDPATPLRSGMGIVCLSRDNRKYCANRIKLKRAPSVLPRHSEKQPSGKLGCFVESPAWSDILSLYIINKTKALFYPYITSIVKPYPYI